MTNTITAHGWAVIDGGKIDIKTVSESSRAAIVNWLCTHGFLALQETTDHEIALRWDEMRGSAFVNEVFVTSGVHR